MILIKQQIEEQLPKDVSESTKERANDLFTDIRWKLPLHFKYSPYEELQFMYTMLLLAKSLITHVVADYITHNKIDPLDTDQTKRISESFLIECNNAIHNGITVTQVPFMDFDNPPTYK